MISCSWECFPFAFKLAVWLEKQSSDLQLLSWRLGRGKSELPKCIGYSEDGSTASHKSSNKLLVILVIWAGIGKSFFWLMELRDSFGQKPLKQQNSDFVLSFLCSWRQGSCWYKNYVYQIYNSKGRPVNSHRYGFCDFCVIMCIIESASSPFVWNDPLETSLQLLKFSAFKCSKFLIW